MEGIPLLQLPRVEKTGGGNAVMIEDHRVLVMESEMNTSHKSAPLGCTSGNRLTTLNIGFIAD
jgi:hypothetical protein